ncbi:hypothetical protein GCM10022224_039940 [Nonomuraea antimicrobica]|uniref:Uncharacterized protein n=1 Tax=Nonomuraea antimicrobica TaxID=561173 RepID=A0ABP7BYE1_9ACTN
MPATPARPELGPRGQAGAATFEIRLVPADEVHRILTAVTDTADEVFTRPPWTEPHQTARALADRLAADALGLYRRRGRRVAALHGAEDRTRLIMLRESRPGGVA